MFPSEFKIGERYRHPTWNGHHHWKGPKYYMFVSSNGLFKDPGGHPVWLSKAMVKLLGDDKWELYNE